ncbi:MAG TPA: hypothetical protein VLX28_11515 [Thermoanaerobaculia bacterium]|nr:hypothetical protein [Thermoanaerobaculia bacterium]
MKEEMRQRNSFFSVGIALLLACFVACGGGGRSPTEPGPRLPNIAGAWTGSWGLGFIGVRSTMDLAQDANGKATGTLAILGLGYRIEGTVTATRFSWHLADFQNSDCPSFAGDLDLTLVGESVTMMSGTATQVSCIAGSIPQRGTLFLSRAG